MKELHLFAGTGGGLLASKLLGHTPVCAVEINRYCQKVLRQRVADGIFPEMEIHGDIRDFDGSPWMGKVDLIAGGWPCQDLSIAWKGKGLSGARSGLFFELVRVVRQVKPRWVFLENVPNLLGKGFDTVLRELSDSGYDAAWTTLSASACGAGHVRRRLWILAHANSSGCREQRRDCTAPEKHTGNQRGNHVPGASDSCGIERQDCQNRLLPLGYRQICFWDDCDPDTEECPCGRDYASECLSPGPTEDGIEYAEFDSVLYGRRNIGDWENEPGICRMVDGLASRVDRIRSAGNGQVPLVAAAAFKILENTLRSSGR